MVTVLVIEDNDDQREIVEAVLVAEGHAVCAVPGGDDVVAVYEACQPDWVVLDLVMPPPGGLMVLETLRQAGIKPRVVLWTAYLDTRGAGEVLEKTRGLGVEAYIEKGELGENLLSFLGTVDNTV